MIQMQEEEYNMGLNENGGGQNSIGYGALTPHTKDTVITRCNHGRVGRMIIDAGDDAFMRFEFGHVLSVEHIPYIHIAVFRPTDDVSVRIRDNRIKFELGMLVSFESVAYLVNK